MRVGIVVRNMGAQSTRETLVACATAVDAAPAIADLWVTDHIAIPPDDAEGSDGRYLDPLATLAFLAGATTRVGLGTSVLVVPYRPPLPTAKLVSTVQELSGGRLLLGVGVGWMAAEFRVLGIDLGRRGRITDETLGFLDRCFADDVVEANGQPFLFRPRPTRPPLFIGGAPPHAFRRAVRHRAGWMPIGLGPEQLPPLAAELRARAADAGLGAPPIAVLTALPLDDAAAARDRVARFADAGASRVIHGARYADVAGFRTMLDRLVRAAGG
ncbi:MAG: TIGR03619 family F420-dependent LLM class oxidoreductase [Deltaproteobacteria bacterium]|nr:MAG: TIGR03619 family F420-dependent LLM class oxidoreductase [Deltaproteobacteria bacterium]